MRSEDFIFLPSEEQRILHVLWMRHDPLLNVWCYRVEMCPKRETRSGFVIQLPQLSAAFGKPNLCFKMSLIL